MGFMVIPKGPCTHIVYTLALHTLALKYSYIGTLGPKYMLFGYMDP